MRARRNWRLNTRAHWEALPSKQKKWLAWGMLILGLCVVSAVSAVLQSLGILEPAKVVTSSGRAPHLERATPKSAQRAAPPVVSESDVRLRVPPTIEGFQLSALGDALLKPDPVRDAITIRAEYLAKADPMLEMVLWIDTNDEPLPPAKPSERLKIAGRQAICKVDTALNRVSDHNEVAVSWRDGPLLFSVFARQRNKQRGLSKLRVAAESFASAVANQSRVVPTTGPERVAALETLRGSVDPGMATVHNFESFATRLPEWAASSKLSGNTVTVTVFPAWHGLPESFRETEARALWKRWASVNTPTDLDRSFLVLADASGHSVGGSGMMGSSISVD